MTAWQDNQAKQRAARTAAIRKAKAGYVLQWPHGGWDSFKRTTAKAGPAWHVRCNAHGTFHPAGAKNATEADKLGRARTWCDACKAA
jgi:hypothetical protein